MDLGTVVGFVLTVVLLSGAMAMGVGIGPYVDIASILIVFGGTSGVVLVGFKMEQIKNLSKIFMVAVMPPKENMPKLIKTMVDYSTKARRDGILALETDANSEENDFLKKGLSMAVDGSEPDTIRDMLETEMEKTSDRHKANAQIFAQLGGFSGAMGMIGTLIGLVAMLLNMTDPSAIGPAMALALLTTMYGAMIGNIIGSPIANILEIRNDDETLSKTLIIEGIMAIQAGDNPRILEGKLLAFLSPKMRISQFD
ncbi:MAG: motility protein A [Sulfurospirillum sp.]|nr:motility protein A [Sulfurospirillum sp.]MBL0703362.1 motility protein A [Sulfurospirillum sp.]